MPVISTSWITLILKKSMPHCQQTRRLSKP
uniref:Uncharacterized protein n=1 Tax=Arundo donax TaxID=35708 RepID=A0A0A9B8G9_ARUDO